MKFRFKLAAVFLVTIAFAVGIVFCAADAFAQDPPAVDAGTVDAGTQPADEGAPADGEVTAEDLVNAAKKAAEDWETLGWIGGMVGVIGFLLLLLRYKPLDKLLEDRGIKWIKPYIAIGLGVLLGFFSTFANGKSIFFSIMMGLAAGVMSPGLHQLLTGGNKK